MCRRRVTVIVPVYNVSQYIEQCARSLFEQTLDSLEIIFVDDCSPDNSIDIIKKTLEKFPNRKSHTRIITMPSNGGLAAVRKRGIIEATGDYIIHCDGDDWVDPDYYRTLYQKAIETEADIICGDYVSEESDGQYLMSLNVSKVSGKVLLEELYHRHVHMGVWNKLIRRSLYTDNDILPWTGLNMWEDSGLMYRLLYYARKIEIVKGPCYHYNRLNPSAMTATYGLRQVEQMIGIATRLTEFFAAKPDAKRYCKSIQALQFYAKLNLITDSFKRLRLYDETFPGAEKIIPDLTLDAFSSKGRIRFMMVKYHLTWLFILLFKLRGIILRLKN